ncbi:PQQ-binding-like beta-propeller repeat protein [Brooklawnia sp.]|uniref:outer membrane protein assembly factor BamB family protein n=1 Tax=Brooklawnia sp. TaxID=2699740 RepID=UPI00311D748C
MTIVSATGVAVALVWSIALAIAAAPSTQPPRIPAGGYLAESGHREFLTDGAQLTIVETSRLPGGVAFSDGSAVIQRVLEHSSFEEASSDYWIREIAETPLGIAARLLKLDDRGLVSYAIDGPNQEVAFDNGIVELPSDPQPGASWTSLATATNAAGITGPWNRVGSITASQQQGCLEITITDRFRDTETVSTLTRCEQRGIVAVGDAIAGNPPRPDTSGLSLLPPPDVIPSSDPVSVSVHTGGIPMSVGMSTPPVAVGDRLVFANRTNGHLDFVVPGANGQWDVSIVRRPGRDTTRLLGIGDLVVAATTDRTLVAYDAQGRWLWQADIPDLASDLFWVGDETAAALTLDDQLTVFALADGSIVRTTQMPSGSTVRPAVVRAGSQALIATAAGRQVAILYPDGEIVTLEVRDDVRSFTMTDHGLIVSDLTADLTAFDLNGTRLWRVGMSDSCRDLVQAGESIICRLADKLTALNPASGEIDWQESLSPLTSYVAADQILSLGRQTTTLLSSDGAELASWPIERTASNTWTIPMADGLLVASGSGQFEWWQS